MKPSSQASTSVLVSAAVAESVDAGGSCAGCGVGAAGMVGPAGTASRVVAWAMDCAKDINTAAQAASSCTGRMRDLLLIDLLDPARSLSRPPYPNENNPNWEIIILIRESSTGKRLLRPHAAMIARRRPSTLATLDVRMSAMKESKPLNSRPTLGRLLRGLR